MKKYNVIASQIYIIDLLSIGESNNHTEVPLMLDNKLQSMVNNHIQGWGVEYHKCLSLNSLKVLLQQIANDYNGEIPIIHIVCHGSKSVFQIDKKCYKWQEMFVELREINKRTCNNLVVTVLACKGAYALRAATEALFQQGNNLGNANGECPVYALLTPEVDIYPHDARVAFETFYEELIHSRDLHNSVSALKNALDEMHKMYMMPNKVPRFSCFFSDDEIEKELKRAVPKVFSKPIFYIMRLLFKCKIMCNTIFQIKKKVREGMNQTYKTFLMVDCCKENEKRFTFNVDKLVDDSWNKP